MDHHEGEPDGSIRLKDPIAPARRDRRWPWRLAFGLAVVYAWAVIALYFVVLSIGSLADCADALCEFQKSQGLANGENWGSLFSGCTLIATVLAILATERVRLAAVALVVFATVVATATYSGPRDESGMRATGFMAITFGPLVLMAILRWWSLGIGPLHEAAGRFHRAVDKELFG